MIPLKLELENFLAYRHPEPLDLSGLHLACLAGHNGAGKSSLLDAMTWALWGKARTQRDDDLIYGDEIEMQVRFTFLMDGHCYRVLRYRTRKGRGSSELHFEIQDGDGWRSLSEPTIRDTQERITGTLRLDYETFINSAFLMQGRADEFTQKTPGKRKAILSDILGLDVWATYEERTKKRLRAIDAECRQNEGLLDSIDQELAREDAFREELARAEAERDELTDAIHEAEEYVRQLDAARRDLAHINERYTALEAQANRDQAELAQIHTEREEYQARLAAHAAILAQREEIETGIEDLEAARAVDQDLSERLMAQTGLQRQRHAYEQQIASEHSRLQTEQSGLRQQRAKLLQVIADNEGREQALLEARARLPELEARQGELEEWDERLTQLKTERAQIETTNRALKTDMETLRQQQEQIMAATEPRCPLCQQDLSDEHRAELLERLAEDGSRKGDQFRANRDRLRELEAEIAALSHEIERARNELRNLPPLHQHIATLEEKLRQAALAAAELASVDEQLEALERSLAENAYAAEARAGLAAVQQQLAELGYDEGAHAQARQRIKALAPLEARKRDLDFALKSLPETEAQIARLDERAAAREAIIEDQRRQLEEMTQAYEQVHAQVTDLQPWEDTLGELRDEYGRAQNVVGMARQRLNTLDQQRQRRTELIARQDELAGEQSVYGQLREAFGKDGIPAMIIEATIPEIEMEANDLLAKMTDGRMHVRFDTQREKVTGGVKETLDIKIADELGTRDYETFSGGEAFRVNFAIRLALSRLLARRAGAQLRTLFMDEGFGTQDAQGRERLVQAINAIKDEFDLILVITHIEELMDAFPVRIAVNKTPNGSMVEIV